MVYRGTSQRRNRVIFRKVTGFCPWFHVVGTGSFWLGGMYGSVTKDLIWLPRSCCPLPSVIISRWIAAEPSLLFIMQQNQVIFFFWLHYRIFGYWPILCATHRHCIKMALYIDQKIIYYFLNFICRMYRLHFWRHQLKKYFFGVLSWRTEDVCL